MPAAADFVFEDRPDDIARTPLEVEGTMPVAVRGAFLANGPGRTKIGGRQLNLFDAYGRVLAATVGEGGVSLVGRHVQTSLYEKELAAGQVLRRRLYANKDSRWSNLLDVNLGNNCMHNVFAYAGHVVAAQDPGHFALDPETLEVTRRLDYGGRFAKGMNATPMARRDPSTGRLVLWLQKPGPKDTITVVELDEKLTPVHETTCKLPPGLNHDIAFSSDYYVISRFATLGVLTALWGARPVFDAVQFGAETPILHLIPRKGGPAKTLPLPKRMHFHFFNVHDDGGELVVDTIGYPGRVSFSMALPEDERRRLGVAADPTPFSEVVRYRISPDSLEVKERVMPQLSCEAPELNPEYRGKPYRYGYAVARTPGADAPDPGAYVYFGSVAKLDFDANERRLWTAPAGCTCSPPAFVADPARTGEDAGYLLTWVQDPAAGTSSMVVLDAADIEAGPVAQARYPGLFGFVSHTSFAPA